MNRNSGNASKTKNLISGSPINSKPNRKSFQKLSESSSLSSNRNSSSQSEDEAKVGGVCPRSKVAIKTIFDVHEQDVKKLQEQVKELRLKVRTLEESIERKDYSLETIARDKDRAIEEVKRLEKTIKQLKKQLNDERNHYLEEKERFCQEMTKCKKRVLEMKTNVTGENKIESSWFPTKNQSLISQSLKWELNNEKGDFAENKTASKEFRRSKLQGLTKMKEPKSGCLASLTSSEPKLKNDGSMESFHLYEGEDLSLRMAALQTENAKLRSIICERDERNYGLCLRFLRMKHYKNDIKTRFQDLEKEYLQVITNLMEKIDEARQEFNFIIDQKFKKPIDSTNAMYLQLVQRNSKMAFENASLRLENQYLKKELNKNKSGSFDFERKIDPVDDCLDSNVKNPTNESNLKRVKKNVNFKEIRTIYERDFSFKNSDTDSNYMSKTSTTVPSNGSLKDPKSNESIVIECQDQETEEQNKEEPSFHANSLPDEILNQLFKRVDSSSCQLLDSERLKTSNRSEDDKGSKAGEPWGKDIQLRTNRLEFRRLKDEPKPLKDRAEDKTGSSSPDENRDSPRTQAKKEGHLFLHMPPEFADLTDRGSRFDDEVKERLREQDKQSGEKLPFWRSRNFTRDGNISLEFPFRRHDLFGRRPERISLDRNAVRMDRFKAKPFRDSCALQEKIDISDFDPSESTSREIKAQILSTLEKNPEPLILNQESDTEEVEIHEQKGRHLVPAIGSRSRSSNKLSLQEELMEVTRKHLKTESYAVSAREAEPEISQPRRQEGSKRFSHRLISTSPEQLKFILSESQFEACYRMAPAVVGHVTVEVKPEPKSRNISEEILLQLVTPKAGQSSQMLTETREKETAEKETSTSAVIPPVSTDSPDSPVEICFSDIKISVSNFPTSSSTIEMVDSGGIQNSDRNNIILRTLSAPGLLESSWLDPRAICEMRDRSTNT